MDLHSKDRGIHQIRWKYVDLNYGNYISRQRVIPRACSPGTCRHKAQTNLLEVGLGKWSQLREGVDGAGGEKEQSTFCLPVDFFD
jgi:hypothetical protein